MKKSPNSLNVFSITKATLLYFAQNWKKLLLLTTIVALPASLLRSVQLDSTTDASLVASIAGFFLTLCLYWCFGEKLDLKKTSIAKAFVLSSSRILPFILATIILSLFSLPIVFGILIIVLAVSAQISLWFGLVGIFMSIFGVYILVKSSLITTIVALEESSTFTALSASWAFSKRKFWKLLFNWVYLFSILVILSGIVLTPILRISFVSQSELILAFINGILLVIVLPITVGYITNIYRRLA